MRKLLQIIFHCFKRKQLIRFITSALSVGSCICAKFGSFELGEGDDNMFGKQYFKVDLFIDKKSVQDLYDKISSYQNSDANAHWQIQCVHTEKKVPCITVQVRGYDQVKDLIQTILEYPNNFGYCIWLSKEEDFDAVKNCGLSIFEIDNVNVLIDLPKKAKDKDNASDDSSEANEVVVKEDDEDDN